MVSSVKSVFLYKLRAALVSFAIFFLFAALLFLITYYFWYPDYLFWQDGGIQGLRLVYVVGFILGPLLATVFFHPEKSRNKLIFDVSVIALVQAVAMAWGGYQIYSQRPAVVVYGSNRFISIAPGLLAFQHKTVGDMHSFSNERPPYAYRREPHSDQEHQKAVILLMRYGIHFEAQVWLFEPFGSSLGHVFGGQTAIRNYILQTLPDEWTGWSANRQKRNIDSYLYAFYEGRYGNAMLIFSPEGKYLGWLDMGAQPLPDIASLPVVSVNKAH